MKGGVLGIVVTALAVFGLGYAQNHPCDIPDNFNNWVNNYELKDVVIVGAGMAGLSAARILLQEGVSNIVVLEAQDYVGGRVKTHRQDGFLTEDGAEWIHGGWENRIYKLANKLNLLTQPLPTSAYDWKAKTQSGQNADLRGFDAASELMETCEINTIQDQYAGQGYGACYADRFEAAYRRHGGKASEKDAWLMYLQRWVLKDTGLLDWQDLKMEDADNFDGADLWNQWKSGFDALVTDTMKSIPSSKVKTSSPVCRIYWDSIPDNIYNEVLVVTKDGKSYLAQHVIVTASLGHLKERRTQLLPDLKDTDAFTKAMNAAHLGLCNKVQIGWEKPWWGPKELNIQVIFTEDLPKEKQWLYGIMEYLTIHQQESMLQGFVSGEEAYQIENIPEETLKKDLVQFLKDVMQNNNIPEPIFFRRSQWYNNPWMRGSYNSYIETGTPYTNRKGLNEHIVRKKKQIVVWAGEHTQTVRYGTVDGAMDSGEIAADVVLNNMPLY